MAKSCPAEQKHCQVVRPGLKGRWVRSGHQAGGQMPSGIFRENWFGRWHLRYLPSETQPRNKSQMSWPEFHWGYPHLACYEEGEEDYMCVFLSPSFHVQTTSKPPSPNAVLPDYPQSLWVSSKGTKLFFLRFFKSLAPLLGLLFLSPFVWPAKEYYLGWNIIFPNCAS